MSTEWEGSALNNLLKDWGLLIRVLSLRVAVFPAVVFLYQARLFVENHDSSCDPCNSYYES
jgi:hypothetical protein